jgi:hypothetical protein
MPRALILILAFTTLTAGPLGTIGFATQDPQPADQEQAYQESDDEAANKGPEAAAVSCDGGAQKAVRVRSDESPFLFQESASLADIPGSEITYSLEAGQTDTFVATFSAESRLNNRSREDFIEIQILHNGVPMLPTGGASPCAFSSADSNASHAVTVCKRVSNTTGSAATQTFKVQVRLQDNAPTDLLQGWIDDWTFHLEVSE